MKVETIMDKFWEDTMNYLLGIVLYHGQCPDEKSWCKQYAYEVNNMVEDIKNFHNKNADAGLEVSNEAMARFLVYTEAAHIGNAQFVNVCPIDEFQLIMIATKINDELN